MVVNFRVHGISRGARKPALTSTLIKKTTRKKNYDNWRSYKHVELPNKSCVSLRRYEFALRTVSMH
jgi:hypothetical protein